MNGCSVREDVLPVQVAAPLNIYAFTQRVEDLRQLVKRTVYARIYPHTGGPVSLLTS